MSEGHHLKTHCIQLVPIFQNLETEEMERIASLSHVQTYDKGDMIYHAGEEENFLYIVHKGKVKVTRLMENGKEQLLRILESGDFMGELALFTKNIHDSYAESSSPTELCVITREDFQEILAKHPEISMKVLEEVSHRLSQAEKLMTQLSAQDAEIRIASYLLDLAEEQHTNNIVLPMSKKDIASYLGTTQETLSRKLSSMQEKGWINQKGHRHIRLLEKESLFQITHS
ncbi:Crp/Fnr family transcriptional regulator [Alteribacillus iranensis]|uniref:CRP/FNR family transcriptional regulator, anaerobic regulatory protein n=1 Tax=Alteribacillus iranensis TaxID=930128 RepID=A0A1I2E597_9BACI|nr:Crp/Fnr family transcriptional regulator [Alteribacillus iranensis]SFE88015.1 CRP/FNR family transcriptional regulator, anaerobic regulatory protein [Alteribacillus iranensis]